MSNLGGSFSELHIVRATRKRWPFSIPLVERRLIVISELLYISLSVANLNLDALHSFSARISASANARNLLYLLFLLFFI